MIPTLVKPILRIFTRLRRYFRRINTYELKSEVSGIRHFADKLCKTLLPVLSLLSFAMLIYDVGFNAFFSRSETLYLIWKWLIRVIQYLLLLRLIIEFSELKLWRSRIFNLALVILAFYLIHSFGALDSFDPAKREDGFLTRKLLIYLGVIFLFLTEASNVLRFIYKKSVNPAFLFVFSFFLLICVGALLLLLPKATTHGISPVDAFFTSASAVCVTGLVVVDTATAFTTAGKIIILILIQIGGLGIMTFAGLLAYLTAGSVSITNQLAMKDMVSSNQISNVLGFVVRVLVVTLFFEAIGGILIHTSLDNNMFTNQAEKLFFSVFHTISAFCNAGFSTLTNGLYEAPIRFNYTLHLIIAGLVILGGMGFPIVFNIFTYLRIKLTNLTYKLLKIPREETFTHVLHTSSKLALFTSLILLVTGFAMYMIFEQGHSLKEHHSLWGKIVTSFFGSVTPRTAGFNTVNMTLLSGPMIMIYLLLMWIGASPGSTGGGIKTTVAAVAALNLRSIVLGKSRTEVFKMEISETSTRRAFAIIILSLMVLGVSTMLITVFQPKHTLLQISFETFSAFSTVGLSLGITPELNLYSKIILAIVMLVGRVGTLTMIIAFIAPAKPLYHRYPKEEILL